MGCDGWGSAGAFPLFLDCYMLAHPVFKKTNNIEYATSADMS